jgi:hypothetical protein
MNSRQNIERIDTNGDSKQSTGRMGKRVFFRACILAGSVLGSASLAQAQFVVGPAWGGGWGNSVGTAESSYLHGAADAIRAEGAYNLYTAKAMSEYQDARAKYLANRREATRNYLANKEFYNAQQNAKRERNRAANEAARDIKSDAPSPLGPEAFDAKTGKIAWPKALLDSQFASKRAEVERLFDSHATSSSGGDEVKKVRTIAAEMAATLKGKIKQTNANDYTQARKFLERLAITG